MSTKSSSSFEPVSSRPRSGQRWVLVLILLALVALSGYWLGSRPQYTGGKQEVLVIDPVHLDFGEVWEDPAFVWTLPIENHTSKDVPVAEFVSSCSDLKIEPVSALVPAGGKTEVRLTIDLAKGPLHPGCGAGYAPPQSSTSPVGSRTNTGLRDVTFQVFARLGEDVLPQTSWSLRGRVRSAFSLSARVVSFDDHLVRGRAFVSQSVALVPHTPLADITAECDPTMASADLVRDGERYLIQIRPKESLPAGPFQFDVAIRATAQNGGQVTGNVIVTGRVLGDLYLFPDLVVLGARPLGQSLEETVVVQARIVQPFEVVSTEATSEDVHITPIYMIDVHAPAFRVTQVIARPGDQTTTVRFIIRRTAGASPEELTLLVSYHGIPDQ